MATGKIDRQQVAARLQQAAKPESGAPAAPAAKVEDVKQQVESLFGARSKALDPVTGPDGQAVSTTATANALWGQAAVTSANPPLAALRLKSLTPEQAKAKMTELKAK